MNTPRPILLLPRRSRLGLAAIALALVATAIMVEASALPSAVEALAWGALAAAGSSALRKLAGANLPRALRVGIDRRVVLVAQDGREEAGELLDDCYVGATLVILVWRSEHAWLARSCMLLPDSLDRETLRRLRVLLRYSRAAGAALDASPGNSGEEAG